MKFHCYIVLLFITRLLPFVNGEFDPTISITRDKSVSKELIYFDDSSSILALRDDDVYISNNNGQKWQKVNTIDQPVVKLQFDHFNKDRAFALTTGSQQFYTSDKGNTWGKFTIKNDKNEDLKLDTYPRILPNALNKDLALFDFYNCPTQIFSGQCKHHFYYTTDGFKSNPKKLNVDASICQFDKSSKLRTAGKAETIYCVENKLNSFGHIIESNLIKSDDFFKTKQTLNHHFSKSGKLIDVRVEQNFVIAVVQNDKFNSKSKVTLLVSKDGKDFEPSDLQIDIAYGIMTFLQSSPLSLFLSVAAYNNMFRQITLSTVYASDSSGLKFKKVLENVQGGAFEKIQTIDGVWLTNVVDTDTSIDDNDSKSLVDMILAGGSNKASMTKISFNDGKDFHNLKVEGDDDCKDVNECSLHLLTPSERDGEGNFVTGPTPGILMGVGNTGKSLLKDLSDMKTFLSRDGGATWTKVLDMPCLFSFGDLGNVIIATPYYGKDESSTSDLYYSLDQGKSWTKKELETKYFPLTVTTTIDGTSTNFILSGLIDETPDNNHDFEFSEIIYAIDFSKAYNSKCKKDDYEDIYARVAVDDKKPICIYGHLEKFKRRKADAKCFAATLFEDVTVYDESCDCTEDDFECAVGYKLNKDNHCEPDKNLIAHMCRTKKVKELILPDKVLIDGNECSLGKNSVKKFVTDHKLKCSDYVDKDDSHHEWNKKISHHKFSFESKIAEYTYFEQGVDYNGENVLVRTTDNRLYASRDGGVEFVKVPIYEEILAYYMGYVPGQMVLITGTQKFFVSVDAGNTYEKLSSPLPPSPVAATVVAFHKTDPKQFIWFGSDASSSSCGYAGDKFNKDCKITGYLTKDGGESFDKLRDDIIKCDFVSSHLGASNNTSKVKENLIYCTTVDKEKKTINLISTSNNFKDEKVIAENIVGYAISGNFVIVGKIDEKKQSLNALVTIDGETFADAAMPRDLDIDIRQAFTVLDSEKGAIFMHVTTKADEGHEYGAILKSNSNGTSYALSLDYVNRDKQGFVDYDRVEGIEGILISNVVYNHKHDSKKKLKTRISHNDGGEWNFIVPPSVSSEKKKYDCNGKSLKDCSLNLHGFTERADYRDTYSSASAVGIMMALGNVGATLTDKKDSSLFLTRDGGVTWKEIKKGVYMWEYGDRGSILVIVKEGKTKELLYSLDEGSKWIAYKFSKEEIDVKDLATVPSDNSRKFIIFAENDDGTSTSISIDFTNIYDRQCQLDLDNPDNDDFEYWSPKHPSLGDNCLFGHEAKYLRRAKGHHDCFIGSAPLTDGYKIVRNCSCTRKDYECDYNYYRDFNDDTCKLVKGLSPADHKKEMCLNNVFEYVEPTGYRKIPLSTCAGGKHFDAFEHKPCPGKESEFNKYYGRNIGFGKLLLIVGLPLLIFIFVTWFVYDRGIRRNGGFKQFGQIRLDGEEDDFEFQPIENNIVDKVVNKTVKGGIITVAALIATFKTLRKFDKIMFDKLTSQIFRGRTGRRNYVRVPDIDEEEEELFGNFQDNYEEELQQGNNELYRDLRDDEQSDNNQEITDDSVDEIDADARLFDVDDHSDDEPPTV